MSEQAAKDLGRTVFADRFDLAERYADLLAGEGTTRGLIGPRETERLWSRHLMNSAGLESAIAEGSTVVDVGSGAGLPGLPLALARPDLEITLVEPLLRRTTFLEEVVEELELGDRVRVVRGRAEDVAGEDFRFDVVTSRAVAALDRLVRWCAPLMGPRGQILAVKGSSAQEEIDRHRKVLERVGLSAAVLHLGGRGEVAPTIAVRLRPTL